MTGCACACTYVHTYTCIHTINSVYVWRMQVCMYVCVDVHIKTSVNCVNACFCMYVHINVLGFSFTAELKLIHLYLLIMICYCTMWRHDVCTQLRSFRDLPLAQIVLTPRLLPCFWYFQGLGKPCEHRKPYLGRFMRTYKYGYQTGNYGFLGVCTCTTVPVTTREPSREPQPSTLNPQPSTLNPQPSTLNPKP